MSSNIWVKNGIYDPSKRFAFTNITDESFTFTWAKRPITVAPHETVELPHHLAVLATTDLVDRIMLKEAQVKTIEQQRLNPGYKAPNQAGSLGVPAARDPWEKKILKELPPRDDNDAQLQVTRARITEELQRDLAKENSPHITNMSEVIGASSANMSEFEGINLPKNN